MKYFVITGPECSGKTVLGNQLSAIYNYIFVEEYARPYLEQINRPYTELDLDEIAKHQMASESTAAPYTIFDTDLLTTYIWKEEVYGSCRLDWLQYLGGNTSKIYLLCKPDIPWIYDPQRENPHDRDRLYEKYKYYLEFLNLDFLEISGTLPERIYQAKNIINQGFIH